MQSTGMSATPKLTVKKARQVAGTGGWHTPPEGTGRPLAKMQARRHPLSGGHTGRMQQALAGEFFWDTCEWAELLRCTRPGCHGYRAICSLGFFSTNPGASGGAWESPENVSFILQNGDRHSALTLQSPFRLPPTAPKPPSARGGREEKGACHCGPRWKPGQRRKETGSNKP